MRLLRNLQLLWSDRLPSGDEIEPSERRFRTIVLFLMAILLPPMVWTFYHLTTSTGLVNPDAMDAAQLARHLADGKGFVTYVLRPLNLVHGNQVLSQPEAFHGPLFPLTLAVAFLLSGTKGNDFIVSLVSGLFYLLTIPVIYRLATRVFNRAVGLVTTLIFTFSALILQYADSGMPITLYIFLTTWLLLIVYELAVRARDYEATRQGVVPTKYLIMAGLMTAGLYLTDFVFLWYVPFITFTVIWLSPNRRLASTMRFLIPMAIPVLICMIHNQKAGGNPFFGLRYRELWMWTQKYPEYVGYRLFPGELQSSVTVYRDIVTKVLLGIGRVIQDFPQVTASWVLAFFLPSLLFRFTDPATNALRRAMMLCFLGILIGTLLFAVEPNMPMFIATIPTMLAFAVAYLLHLIRQAQMIRSSQVVTGILLGIAILFPLFYALKLESRPVDMTEGRKGAIYYSSLTKPTEICFTDNPQLVAWYANRPAIWIPANDIRIRGLRNRFANAKYLFLTDSVRLFGAEWINVYQYFGVWNSRYLMARAENVPAPDYPTVNYKEASGDPFLEALSGFTAVAPNPDKPAPSIIIAKLNPVSESGR